MDDPDSVWQFQQAQTFRFDDQHPVAMALLWSVFNLVWPGTASMLCFQLALYWGAAGMLLDRALSGERPRALPAVLFLLAAPYTLWFLDEVMKDVQLVAAWSFASALVYFRRSRGRPVRATALLAATLLVIYGGLVRNNAGLVAGPLLLYVFTGRPRLVSSIRTIGLYLSVAVGFVLLGKALSNAVGANPTVHAQLLLYFDLVGISKQSGQNVVPLPLDEDGYRHLLDGFTGADIAQMPFPGRLADPSCLTAQRTDGQLLGRWIVAVLSHPFAYVAHRARFLKCFLVRRDEDSLEHCLRTVFSRPIVWIFWWCVAVLWFRHAALARASHSFVETQLVIGALYLLTYFPFGVGWGWRYVYPLVTSMYAFGLTRLLAASSEQ